MAESIDDRAPLQGPTVQASVARNMMISLLGNVFPPVAALLSGPILAHALGVDGRGAVAAATAPLGLVTTLATFGLPEAVTYTASRFPTLVRIATRRVVVILLVAGLFATGAVIAAQSWLAGGDPNIASLITVAACAIVPNLLLGVLRAGAAALQRWGSISREKILASSLRLLALTPFWLTGTLTPTTATIVLAVMPLAGALSYIRLTRHLSLSGPDEENRASYRSLSRYGVRIWIGSISGILLSRVDQTLMTPLVGPYQLGLYVVAVSVSELPLIVNAAVRDVIFATDAADNVDDRLTAAARISTMCCAVIGLGLGVSMGWWLPRLFGSGFEDSLPVASILLVAVVLGTPGSVGGAALSARGRPGLRSISLVIACGLNLGMLFVLVPTMGAVGAALATLAGNIVSSNLNLIFLSRLFGLPVKRFYGFRRSDARLITAFVRRGVRPKRR